MFVVLHSNRVIEFCCDLNVHAEINFLNVILTNKLINNENFEKLKNKSIRSEY